jgi:hypothetical protein
MRSGNEIDGVDRWKEAWKKGRMGIGRKKEGNLHRRAAEEHSGRPFWLGWFVISGVCLEVECGVGLDALGQEG